MRVLLVLVFILLPRLSLGQEIGESPPVYNQKLYKNLFVSSEPAFINLLDLSVSPDFFEKSNFQNESPSRQAARYQDEALPLDTAANGGVFNQFASLGPNGSKLPFDSSLANKQDRSEKNIDYGKLIAQTHLAIGIQHLKRLFEPKTREALKGPFFRDWFRSVNNLRGWNDGDTFFTNWINHTIQGSTSAFIFAQNHKQSKQTRFGDKGYWNTKGKQFLFSVVYSEYFEIGPVSEASIGNIGLRSGAHGYIDHVTTPITGTLLSIVEDIADKYVIDKVRRKSRCLADIVSIFLNPGRTSANFVAFHRPAYRPFNRD